MAHPFEQFDSLVAPTAPVVARDDVLAALEHADKSGIEAVRAETMGNVVYASEMSKRYLAVLAMDEQGLVQPPLEDGQRATIQDKVDTLSVFTQANGESGPATQPTRTDKLKTRGRK